MAAIYVARITTNPNPRAYYVHPSKYPCRMRLLIRMVRAADSLPPNVQGHFADALQRMLGQVPQERGRPPFGTCTSCQHLESDGCSREEHTPTPYACGFTSEPLLLEELDGICINFIEGKPTHRDLHDH